MTTQRTVIVVGAVLAAFLLAATVLLFVVMNQNAAAAEQADHDRIVAICSDDLDDPTGEDVEELLRCIQRLKE